MLRYHDLIEVQVDETMFKDVLFALKPLQNFALGVLRIQVDPAAFVQVLTNGKPG